MADNFLNSDEESSESIPMSNAAEIMPGLAGYVKSRFQDSENGRRSTSKDGYKPTKTFVVSTTLQLSIVTLRDQKYLSE